MNPLLNNPMSFMGEEAAIKHYQRHLVEFFIPNETVLDVGCGFGYMLDLLAERGVKALGVERDERCLEQCRKKGHFTERADAISYLSNESQYFDGILCIHLIEHLQPDQAYQLIRLAVARLNVGGRLIIVTPNPIDIVVITETFWLDPTHVRPYPAKLLESWMNQVGLHNVKAAIATGTDLKRPSFLSPIELFSYWRKKFTFGKHAFTGDTLVVGHKHK